MTEPYELWPRMRAIEQKLQPFFPGMFIAVRMSWKDWENYEDKFSAPVSIWLYEGDGPTPPCIAIRRITSGIVGWGDIQDLSNQVDRSKVRWSDV